MPIIAVVAVVLILIGGDQPVDCTGRDRQTRGTITTNITNVTGAVLTGRTDDQFPAGLTPEH